MPEVVTSRQVVFPARDEIAVASIDVPEVASDEVLGEVATIVSTTPLKGRT